MRDDTPYAPTQLHHARWHARHERRRDGLWRARQWSVRSWWSGRATARSFGSTCLRTSFGAIVLMGCLISGLSGSPPVQAPIIEDLEPDPAPRDALQRDSEAVASEAERLTLEDLLNDHFARDYLLRFAQAEFSEENIAFLLALQTLLETLPREDVAQLAEHSDSICREHVEVRRDSTAARPRHGASPCACHAHCWPAHARRARAHAPCPPLPCSSLPSMRSRTPRAHSSPLVRSRAARAHASCRPS